MRVFTYNKFHFQEMISLTEPSLNIITSVEMILNVSVFTMKIISASVNKIIIVLNASSTILNMIIVTNVCLEENVFKVI